MRDTSSVNRRTLAAYEDGVTAYVDHSGTGPSPLVDVLLALISPGSRVLELGSGPGWDADDLETAGLAVQRTDGAQAFVDRLIAAGRVARVLDMLHDGFGGPWDAVYANAVLLHVPRADLGGVLERILAAVRPGGVLVATFKQGAGEAWSAAKLALPRHFTYWSDVDLRACAVGAGWTEVSVVDSTLATSREAWWTLTATRTSAGPAERGGCSSGSACHRRLPS